MFRVISLTVLLISVTSASLAAAEWTPFINGGEKVQAGDPVAKSTVMIETENQYCSATIISNKTLLTAAHCVGQNEPWVLIHFAGLDGIETRKASHSLRHEAYQDLQDTTRNDMALVFFDGGLPQNFTAASILDPAKELQIGEELQVAGYGQGGPLGTLAKLNLKVVDFLDQKRLIKLDQTTERGICHGDSGGPAFKLINNQMYVVGVASYTNEMDCSGYSVYTRASNYIQWIQGKEKE
ncbi:MAG: S1 family peptidase [Pseudobdellovibrionaceae bacterium]